MLLLQQLSEMWHNENFHIIDTFFRLAFRASRGEEERRKIFIRVPAFVYGLVCSCRRTEAEASMGKTLWGWIFPRCRAFVSCFDRESEPQSGCSVRGEESNSTLCVYNDSATQPNDFSCRFFCSYLRLTATMIYIKQEERKNIFSVQVRTRENRLINIREIVFVFRLGGGSKLLSLVMSMRCGGFISFSFDWFRSGEVGEKNIQ